MEGRPLKVRAEPLPSSEPVELPSEYQPRRLARRILPILGILAVAGLVILLAPGLDQVRKLLRDASPGWIAVAVALEALSCLSYIVMFRPIFCHHMPWRTSWEIGWSELAMGSIVPASGAGGLALGGWILHEGGMPVRRIARRSVAFFLIKSSVNFVAVAVIGLLWATGLFGPHESLWLTAFFGAGAALCIAVVVLLPRLGPGAPPGEEAGRLRRWFSTARRELIGGTAEAAEILRARDPLVIGGAIGYWLFDNLVLWATFNAFGSAPALSVILMGYLIGQLGGLLPLPGGLGGIDGGLLGAFVAYGAPLTVTAAAVLAYRIILFWLPLIVGAFAFVSLRRGLNQPERPELCNVPAAVG
jgi:uncharacterized membrane protein YbhN (UPF0104 family)